MISTHDVVRSSLESALRSLAAAYSELRLRGHDEAAANVEAIHDELVDEARPILEPVRRVVGSCAIGPARFAVVKGGKR